MKIFSQIFLTLLLLLMVVLSGTFVSFPAAAWTPLTLVTSASCTSTPPGGHFSVYDYDYNSTADTQHPAATTIGDFGSNLTLIVIDYTNHFHEPIHEGVNTNTIHPASAPTAPMELEAAGVALNGGRASPAPGLGFELLSITNKGSSPLEPEPATSAGVVFSNSTSLISTTDEPTTLPISDGATRPIIELPGRVRRAVRGVFDELGEAIDEAFGPYQERAFEWAERLGDYLWGHVPGFFLVLMAVFWPKVSWK